MTTHKPHPFDILSAADLKIALRYLPDQRQPDLTIAPDGKGKPYLHRWHLVPRSKDANIYLHLQVDHDPMRPPHDHPWDNFSVILAGGYAELVLADPRRDRPFTVERLPGQTVYRPATMAHHLSLLPKVQDTDVRYCLTQFSTGPNVRDWGFWYPNGWIKNDELVKVVGKISTQREDRHWRV